jgi:hypothetical protein
MSLTARLTGVGTLDACPSSTTAPLSQSTSNRLPRGEMSAARYKADVATSLGESSPEIAANTA